MCTCRASPPSSDPREPPVIPTYRPLTSADNPYTRSKALAEQLVRERQADGKPVVIVYPGGVTGPAAGDSSARSPRFRVDAQDRVPRRTSDGGIGIIDVRDVARALAATLTPGAGPRRFMAGGDLVSLREIGAILHQLTGRRLPVLPTPGAVFRGLGQATDGVRRVVPFDTVFTEEAMEILTLARPTDDSAVHEVLGVAYRPPIDAVEATLRGLYAMGRLSARQAGTLAHG